MLWMTVHLYYDLSLVDDSCHWFWVNHVEREAGGRLLNDRSAEAIIELN